MLNISYYKRKCNGVFSRAYLPRITGGAYVINIDDKKVKKTWVLLYIDRHKTVCFDSFGIEYIPPEVLNKAKYKSIIHNIFRIQDGGFILCEFYWIVFIEYMLKGKGC